MKHGYKGRLARLTYLADAGRGAGDEHDLPGNVLRRNDGKRRRGELVDVVRREEDR